MIWSKEKLPVWIPIYFLSLDETKHRCNICDTEVAVTEKKFELLTHLKENHHEIIELHKEHPDTDGGGYQIEFLQLSSKDDTMKLEPVILGNYVCHLMIMLLKYNRKRSWVWKYFVQMTKTIYRCSLCNVVLSIKGSNSNNMNRHIRTRHFSTYTSEISCKTNKEIEAEQEAEVVQPPKTKGSRMDSRKLRRSWVWSFFTLVSRTRARCKICKRIISHGGNATGNMNRHLKIVHNKFADQSDWVWKVFEAVEDVYACKICDFQFMKYNDMDLTKTILGHLKDEHNVVSGSQIITSDSFVVKNNN
ncbi:unnamed protein product [Pieris macdunnoughi]|uniref:BED-type domain-containing protein n=1 Tax=Pieris macdunnoughi TaxID=345717 RepID=A0A821Q4B1_9NEOP|nr:unnamed protein product [Pieris macdunnoughi]